MIRQIRWRLTATYLIVIFIAMSILGTVLSYLVERQFVAEVHTALGAHGQLLRDHIQDGFRHSPKPGELNDVCQLLGRKINARITVYSIDGTVVGDSESLSGPDSGIPESMKGLREGFGCRICHSEVRKPKTMVINVPLERGSKVIGNVRLAASLYEAQRAAARTRRIILATLVVTSLIAGAVSMRLAGSIAEPISHMNVMARKMASGDLHQRVQVSGQDEVAELAESLNVMADRLHENLDQLAQERDKMETILTTMADGIVVTDRSGAIILFNRASERLFGLGAKQILGRKIESLASIPNVPEMVRQTLNGGKPMKRELTTAVPAERIVNVYAAPIRDQKSAIAGSVAVLQDVTEIRRQAEIRKDFVANVSHELRTPVASIRAVVGALQSGAREDAPAAERFLESLDAETERLSLLLTDLLNLSELESGKQGPRRTVVWMEEIAEQAVSELAEKARKCGVSVSVAVPPDICAFVDKRQVLQVLRNLIDNAVKYTGEGGLVEITGQETEGEINITVRDTGVGIPPADLDRIFERFYRVDKARSRQLGGTGLGLSIVRDIVGAHGGRVAVESKVGEGSAFTIIVPKGSLVSDEQV